MGTWYPAPVHWVAGTDLKSSLVQRALWSADLSRCLVSLRLGPLLGLELSNNLDWLVSKLQASSSSLFVLRLQTHATMCQPFTWVLKIEFRSSANALPTKASHPSLPAPAQDMPTFDYLRALRTHGAIRQIHQFQSRKQPGTAPPGKSFPNLSCLSLDLVCHDQELENNKYWNK